MSSMDLIWKGCSLNGKYSCDQTFKIKSCLFQVFASKVTSMTVTNTEEHNAWTGKVRAAVYGTNGAVSVGLIFADIFGCLGKHTSFFWLYIYSGAGLLWTT